MVVPDVHRAQIGQFCDRDHDVVPVVPCGRLAIEGSHYAPSVEGAENPSAGLYRSPRNTGPHTRAMFEYQDKCVALRCIPNLLPESPVMAVAVEWSTDYVLLGREGHRELVSVKHRDPGQHDWTFGRLRTENVFRDLHAVWRAMGMKGSYFFESNAGFEPALRPYLEHPGDEDRPDAEAVRRLAGCLQVDPAEAGQFMQYFMLRAEPLPDRRYIDDVAARRLAEVMARLGLDRSRSAECLAALTGRIAAASTQRPPDPAQRVDRLVGFMQDLAEGPGRKPAGAFLTMGLLRDVVAEASHDPVMVPAGSPQGNDRHGALRGKPHTQRPQPAEKRDDREPAYRETLRVVRNRTRMLIDRQHEMAELQAFATGGDEHYRNGYLWVCGTPWAGKTALLAEAVQVLSAAGQDVIAYFLIARESQASREQFLPAVAGQLAWLLDADLPPVADVHAFRDLWASAAKQAEEADRRLLLVVDGLDEDLRPGGQSIAALLPTEHLGQHARVLVSARPHPEIPVDVDSAHPLRAARVINLAESPHATAIRTRAHQEISAVLSAGAPGGADDRDLAFDILGLLTAAAGPLTVEDISVMLEASRRNVRAFLASRAARSIEPTGPPREERYSFAHQTLLDYCIAHPDIGGEQAYMTRIRDWAESWKREGWPNTYEASSSTPAYLLDSYPAALARSRNPSDPELLANLVTDEQWIKTALTRAGSQSVLAALHDARNLNPGQPAIVAMLRVVEHQAQQPGDRSDTSPGWTETCLAWDALGHRQPAVGADAIRKLRRYGPPHLIPAWMNTAAGESPGTGSRHANGAVRALALTSAGELVSGGCTDGTVLLWNPGNPGETVREIGRHDGVVLAEAVTEDGLIASGSLDGRIRLWDPSLPGDSGRELGRCKEAVRALAITPDMKIVSGAQDGEIRLWNPADPADPGRILGRHDNQVRAVAVTADGIIVTGSLDGSIRLWDRLRSGKWSLELGRHGSVMDITILSGRYVVSVGLNGSVRLWDARRPAKGHTEMIPDNSARSVVATPDGHILFGCGDGSLGLWDPAVTGNRGVKLGAYPGSVGALATAPGSRVFAANHDVITMFKLAVS